MKDTLDSIPLVKKEIINQLRFPLTDVMDDEEMMHQRMSVLHHATSLGNLQQHKVNIIFEDDEGLKRVNTTIWAITDKKIFLKGEKSIPINRIHSVVIG